jgi:soluble lytic murein transglycosylase
MRRLLEFSALSTLITPLLIALSCTHGSKLDKAHSSRQESLLLAYKKAKSLEASDIYGSCDIFSRLAQEDFALNTLSLVQAHRICPDRRNLAPVSESLSQEQPWLAEADLERQIRESRETLDLPGLVRAQFKKSQKLERTREKVQWLQAALETSSQITSPTAQDLELRNRMHERLHQLAPRLTPSPESKDFLNVGQDWIAHREFEKGRDYLRKVFSDKRLSTDDHYQARRAYRNSFKTEQKKDAHVEEALKFARWIEKRGPASRIHEAYVLAARAQWTEGQVRAAVKTLERAEKLMVSKKHPLDEIYFIRGRIEEEARNYDRALEWLAKAERESRTSSPVRNRILFSQAWLLRKKLNFEQAAEAFLRLKNETQDPFDKHRFTFWLARSYKQAAKPDLAQAQFQELMDNDPLGFYGLVAYRETNQDIPAMPTAASSDSDPEARRPSDVSLEDHHLIQALAFTEEFDILSRFLDLKTADLKKQSSPQQDTWYYYLKAYAKAGLYNPLFREIGWLPTEMKKQLLIEDPELIFPRKHLQLIQAHAENHKVRPELMLSIIRQESAFNTMARSHADAFGLMQLLPQVAKVENFEDLYKPEVNIAAGAALLADLGRKYRGQFVLTVAAYNASEKAIEGWLKTRLQEDPLEFIEDIPYEETKSYVKLVLRNFIFYSRLTNPGQTMAFPHWCLEDLHSFKVSTR